MTAEYVTPRNAAGAVLNALTEIRARESDAGSLMSDTEQCQAILHHLRDYFGGRVFVLQVRNALSLEVLITLLCDDERCSDEVQKLMQQSAERAEDSE